MTMGLQLSHFSEKKRISLWNFKNFMNFNEWKEYMVRDAYQWFLNLADY